MNIYETHDIGTLLSTNAYPGRCIVIGMTEDGKKAVIAYFIMGRSGNSRNRVFVKEQDALTIYPFDPALVEDPSLIIYSPIRRWENHVIVTNGDQTDTIYEHLQQGSSFEAALDTRCFEPDSPNFTPRISGMLSCKDGSFTYKMSILKSADAEGSACNRFTYSYQPLPGLGHFIHTYVCDGNPIPTFQGEPERVRIDSDIDRFTETIWNSLHAENKISLYVEYLDLATGKTEDRLLNKHSK